MRCARKIHIAKWQALAATKVVARNAKAAMATTAFTAKHYAARLIVQAVSREHARSSAQTQKRVVGAALIGWLHPLVSIDALAQFPAAEHIDVEVGKRPSILRNAIPFLKISKVAAIGWTVVAPGAVAVDTLMTVMIKVVAVVGPNAKPVMMKKAITVLMIGWLTALFVRLCQRWSDLSSVFGSVVLTA